MAHLHPIADQRGGDHEYVSHYEPLKRRLIWMELNIQ